MRQCGAFSDLARRCRLASLAWRVAEHVRHKYKIQNTNTATNTEPKYQKLICRACLIDFLGNIGGGAKTWPWDQKYEIWQVHSNQNNEDHIEWDGHIGCIPSVILESQFYAVACAGAGKGERGPRMPMECVTQTHYRHTMLHYPVSHRHTQTHTHRHTDRHTHRHKKSSKKLQVSWCGGYISIWRTLNWNGKGIGHTTHWETKKETTWRLLRTGEIFWENKNIKVANVLKVHHFKVVLISGAWKKSEEKLNG